MAARMNIVLGTSTGRPICSFLANALHDCYGVCVWGGGVGVDNLAS
jgi:hypothetical protein